MSVKFKLVNIFDLGSDAKIAYRFKSYAFNLKIQYIINFFNIKHVTCKIEDQFLLRYK